VESTKHTSGRYTSDLKEINTVYLKDQFLTQPYFYYA